MHFVEIKQITLNRPGAKGCVLGVATSPSACFSRQIGNFSRQNDEVTLRFVCKMRCSTCITFGQLALIRIS